LHGGPWTLWRRSLMGGVPRMRECAGMSLEGVTLRFAEMQLP
jgi:hypothetical protein